SAALTARGVVRPCRQSAWCWNRQVAWLSASVGSHVDTVSTNPARSETYVRLAAMGIERSVLTELVERDLMTRPNVLSWRLCHAYPHPRCARRRRPRSARCHHRSGCGDGDQ